MALFERKNFYWFNETVLKLEPLWRIYLVMICITLIVSRSFEWCGFVAPLCISYHYLFTWKKLQLMDCLGSHPACIVLEVCDNKNLRRWSRLEIKLFRRLTISKKQFLIVIIPYRFLLNSHFTLLCFFLKYWENLDLFKCKL